MSFKTHRRAILSRPDETWFGRHHLAAELAATRSGLGPAAGHRLLPMTDDVVAALQAHKARSARLRLQAGSSYVFTTRTGKPHGARNVIRAFKRALKRAGLAEIRFHDLRIAATAY